MSPQEEKVYLYIKKHPGATTKDLMLFLNVRRPSVWNVTRKLLNSNLIHQVIPPQSAQFYAGKKK